MTANKVTMQYIQDLKRKGAVKTEAVRTAMKKAIKKAVIAVSVVSVILLGVGYFLYTAVKTASLWLDDNRIVVAKPVSVSVAVQRPLQVVSRQKVIVLSSEDKNIAEIVAKEEKPELAKYICDKFGAVNCQVAIAIAKAESGMREDAININTNNTVDLGVYQVNSIHFGKVGCSPKELLDAKKNVDCAHQIWLDNGKSFSPWVAYLTGSYLAKL